MDAETVKYLSQYVHNRIFVGIGTNVAGAWGTPTEAIAKSLQELTRHGFSCISVSSPYLTRPVGLRAQPSYVNVVAELSCYYLPRKILKIFKCLERDAGRRSRVRNGPRPLDLDLLSYRDWVVNWPPAARRPPLVLPHPLLAERAFVLVPLAEIAPDWRHPVLGLTARLLLDRLGGARHLERCGEVIRLDRPLDL